MSQLNDEQYKRCANALRALAIDGVERANSGHPGLPLGAADCAFTLWHDFLRFNPDDPLWPNRDRFVLSAGHGSMLLYGLLHLFGYSVTVDDLKQFRQWDSITPGHPEFGVTPGVEVTTGPLGQGLAMAAGMALAARMAAERFNDEQFKAIDHAVYALASDGDLMEGISHEAVSLAGHLKLANLVCIYDDNGITIEGETGLAFSEDVRRRFEACGWYVQRIDGHDPALIANALDAASHEKEKPSLIIARTHIGYGSPNRQDTAQVHGSPLGRDELAATKQRLGCAGEPFCVPADVLELCARKVAEAKLLHQRWHEEFQAWRRRCPDKAALWDAMAKREVPSDLLAQLIRAVPPEAAATRTLAGRCLQTAAALVPALAGGSADLTPSTNTAIKGSPSVAAGAFAGRNLHFGIREHAMAAMMNGLARSGFFIPYGSTFLVFADYCRPAIRLSALMGLQAIYIFTHDSIFVGEDGPTHQPVEHVAALRLIPGLAVWRPADAVETAAGWAAALMRKDGPTALVLTRQKLPVVERAKGFSPEVVLRGGYVVDEYGAKPAVTLVATGSEVGLAVAAAKLLLGSKIHSRVVSVPCLEQFLSQSREYRDSVIPAATVTVAIEAGRGMPWHQVIGEKGLFIGIERFGASAPDTVLAEKFGFTPAQVAEKVKAHLKR
ncbi:MAG: transketolase [Candidatus Edwardsbacteria bacterium]|jgi:transketolase|nr:transketolase [Candidatus Edwardsbacteria bacterium]